MRFRGDAELLGSRWRLEILPMDYLPAIITYLSELVTLRGWTSERGDEESIAKLRGSIAM